MEERRGESSDVWMQKAGAQFITEDDARAQFAEENAKLSPVFDALGIDPTLSYSAKLVRHAELKRGEGDTGRQTPDEHARSLTYHKGRDSDVFHTLLKFQLGQL